MESIIEHSCYTYFRQVMVWKIPKKGKINYLEGNEISDEIRRTSPGKSMLLIPNYPEKKTRKNEYRNANKFDLILTPDAFERYSFLKNDKESNPEEFLNSLFVKKSHHWIRKTYQSF